MMSPRDARASFAHCGLTVVALEDYLATHLYGKTEYLVFVKALFYH
jgi:hypothetical protein